MHDCTKCGVNKWRWKCDNGVMQGFCEGCGAKTNKFEARSGKAIKNCEEKELSQQSLN